MAGTAYKNERKVILGPSLVEMNARLILQEAQIKLWDIETLNHLLNLYGLPQVPMSAEEPSFFAETFPIDDTGGPPAPSSRGLGEWSGLSSEKEGFRKTS